MSNGWVGVDLDGTLAEYSGWQGELHIGAPIKAMVDRVKAWVAVGQEVRIFTARVTNYEDSENFIAHNRAVSNIETIKAHISAWCVEHIGKALPITNVKDYGMLELWDDRAVQIIPNTGKRADGGLD